MIKASEQANASLRRYGQSAGQSLHTYQSKQDLAEQVEAVLKESLVDPPTLAELAQRFFISRTKLCCDYRDATGKSVGERLLELRIEEAKVLLTTTNKSIGQISQTVGYRFQSSFATAFNRETGRTPQQWRASHRVSPTGTRPIPKPVPATEKLAG